MEELHCFPEFPGKPLCLYFIWDMALFLFTRMVRNLFPTSTVQFAVNCSFMLRIFASLIYTWYVKHFCLLKDVSGQQNFACEVFLGYKQRYDLTFTLSFSTLRNKNKTVKKPLIYLKSALYISNAPLLYIELRPSLVVARSHTNR